MLRFSVARICFELGAKVLVSSSKILYFSSIKTMNRDDFSTFLSIFRAILPAFLDNTINRETTAYYRDFWSEIKDFEAFFFEN